MDMKDSAYEDWKKGMKYKEIADKYGVSLSAVKSWASRHWKNKKVATNKNKKSQPTDEKLQPKPRGAPKGNKNAKGNAGGAPTGNKNSYKHGAYESIYWDTLDEEELKMIEAMQFEEERQLQEQIALFTVRERRLMKSIAEYKDKKGGLALESVIQRKLEIEGNIIQDDSQKQTETTTRTISTFEVIQKLEAELTRVQSKKTRCIEALNKLRNERLKLESEKKGDDLVEDWLHGVMDGDDNEE